jgi:hypothetical protein
VQLKGCNRIFTSLKDSILVWSRFMFYSIESVLWKFSRGACFSQLFVCLQRDCKNDETNNTRWGRSRNLCWGPRSQQCGFTTRQSCRGAGSHACMCANGTSSRYCLWEIQHDLQCQPQHLTGRQVPTVPRPYQTLVARYSDTVFLSHCDYFPVTSKYSPQHLRPSIYVIPFKW